MHSNLFNDLNEIAQLARRQGGNVDTAAMRALDHLRDLEALLNSSEQESPAKSPRLHLGLINPILQQDVDDTIMHVSCVLKALGEVEYEGDIFVEEGDFRLGVRNILSTCESALNMHRKYGNHLPMYAALTDECPREETS